MRQRRFFVEWRMRILLMGNPNVGKSAIFSRLTGAHVVASNYAGTTVEFTRGKLRLADRTVEIIDVPGAYTLEPTNRAEEVAVEMLDDGDVVVNVIDATNLERNLYLTLQLLQSGKPVLVALNMWDEAVEHGIEIDVKELEKQLGVPVVPTCAISGEGVKLLADRLDDARPGSLKPDTGGIWETIGGVIEKVQVIQHRHPTLRQKLSHATVHPVIGPFIAMLVLLASFAVIGIFGDMLHEWMEDLFEFLWLPVTTWISNLLGGEGILHSIIIGELILEDGVLVIDFEESFGLLTTGLFIPFTIIVPFIFCFYIVLSLLEDIGYLPRLGVLIDTMMHRMGLHGLAIVPMLLGIGCNVPGAMAGRMLETRKERFISATLLSICVPCMAQIAMVVALLSVAEVGVRGRVIGLSAVFGTLFILWICLGFVMKYMIKGTTPEILVEIPPYRFPYWKSLQKKVYMRMRGYIREALPYLLLGVFIVNILYAVGVIGLLSRFFEPVITTLFGLPGEAVGALMVGFLRKDVAVGMLSPLGLELRQLIVASVVLVVYFPCAATFAVLFKELGLKDLIKSTIIMIVVALLVGGGLNLVLQAAGM